MKKLLILLFLPVFAYGQYSPDRSTELVTDNALRLRYFQAPSYTAPSIGSYPDAAGAGFGLNTVDSTFYASTGSGRFFSFPSISRTLPTFGSGISNTYSYFGILNVVGNGPASISVDRFSTNTIYPHINLRKARGTTTSPSAILTGDDLGEVAFWGHDGTVFNRNVILHVTTKNVASGVIFPSLLFGFGYTGANNQYYEAHDSTGVALGQTASSISMTARLNIVDAVKPLFRAVNGSAFGLSIANSGATTISTTGGVSGLTITDASSGIIDFIGGGGTSSWRFLASSGGSWQLRNQNLGGATMIAVAPTTGNVIIGSSTDVATASLQVVSTTKGFLPPKMTATQASAISSPAEGIMIYVTDTNGTFTSKGFWGYTGAAWEKLNN